jgi:hypothetical protein
MTLTDCTTPQLVRIYTRLYRDYTAGSGYQPFGYDMATLRSTRPGMYRIMVAILSICNERSLAHLAKEG